MNSKTRKVNRLVKYSTDIVFELIVIIAPLFHSLVEIVIQGGVFEIEGLDDI